jgi:hypothetical protein
VAVGLRIMLRSKLLFAVVPFAIAAFVTRQQFVANDHPCIATADASLQIADLHLDGPWPLPVQAERLVSFTSDPASATVRVQIVDDPTNADFALLDDGPETQEASGCNSAGPTRTVGITERSAATPVVIYLSRDDHADYRIFVSSKTATAKEAAALIVSAKGGRPQQLASKSL